MCCARRLQIACNAHAQCIELDEASSVGLVVGATVVIEGGDAGVKQAVRQALSAHAHDGAFVEFQAHEPVGRCLGRIDQALQELSLGAEPVTVVDQPGVAWHQIVLQRQDFTVQCDGLDGAVGAEQDGPAWGFVAASTLHAHVTVLNLVQATNAMLATDRIELCEHLGWTHCDSIDGDHIAFDELKFNDLGLVGGFFWAAGEAPHALLGRKIGVLQNAAFIADVQQIGIHGVGRTTFSLLEVHGNAVFVGIGQELFTRQQVPLAPRSDHFDIWHQGVGAKLKANLVVAFAGRPVADGVGAGFLRDLHESLGNQWASDGGAQQVLAFIQGIGSEHGEHKVTHKLFAQIFDEDVFGVDPHFDGFGSGGFNFLALTDVGREGHHLAVIGVLQPLQNNGGVESTRVGQHDAFGTLIGDGFFGSGFGHDKEVLGVRDEVKVS